MTAPSFLATHLRKIARDLTQKKGEKEGEFSFRPMLINVGTLYAVFFIVGYAVNRFVPTDIMDIASFQRPSAVSLTLPNIDSAIAEIKTHESAVDYDVYTTENETMKSLLTKLGIHDKAAEDFIYRTSDAIELIQPAPERYVKATVKENGSLLRLKMYLDGKDASQLLEITREGDTFSCSVKPFQYDVKIVVASDVIDEANAQESFLANNIPQKIIAQMHDAFDLDHDKINTLAKGDAFSILYEARYVEGDFVRYGKLLAMQLEHKNQQTELFWFADDEKGGNYYDAKGNIAKRIFMRVPLDVKSVSSEFAPLRRHPITGVVRPHNGTDFRAPWGATVRAAADGVVTFAGVGTGYGNYVKIQHGPEYQTRYAHLSSIDKAIKNNTVVRHGQVIGRVGQTGTATGPHLHYELIVDGVQINPMTTMLPDTATLSPYKHAQLEVLIAPLKDALAKLQRRPENQGKENHKNAG